MTGWILLWAGLAAAQSGTDDARAKEIYENGVILYDEGRYDDAIVAFQEAYRLSERPELLYNIANACERAGRYREAYEALNRYRVYAAADERERLDRRITMLSEKLAADPVTPAPVLGPSPTPASPQPVAGAAGPAGAMPLPATPARRSASWVLIPAGGLLAAGAGSAAAVTWVRSREWVDAGDRDTYEAVRPWNNAALGMTGVGGALAATGVVLTVRQPRRVAVLPAPGGAQLVVSAPW